MFVILRDSEGTEIILDPGEVAMLMCPKRGPTRITFKSKEWLTTDADITPLIRVLLEGPGICSTAASTSEP